EGVEAVPTPTIAGESPQLQHLGSMAALQRQLAIATNALRTVQIQLNGGVLAQPGNPLNVPTGSFTAASGVSADATGSVSNAHPDLRLPEGWTFVPLNPVEEPTTRAPENVPSVTVTAGEPSGAQPVEERKEDKEKEKSSTEKTDTPESSNAARNTDIPQPSPLFSFTNSPLFSTHAPSTSSPLFTGADSSSARPPQSTTITFQATDLLPFISTSQANTILALIKSLVSEQRDALLALLPPEQQQHLRYGLGLGQATVRSEASGSSEGEKVES